MHPVVTDMRKAEAILAWAVTRWRSATTCWPAPACGTSRYNQLGDEEIYAPPRSPKTTRSGKRIPTHMPYIVIVADEMADLMMTAAKEVEQHIIRLAQKAGRSAFTWSWPRRSRPSTSSPA